MGCNSSAVANGVSSDMEVASRKRTNSKGLQTKDSAGSEKKSKSGRISAIPTSPANDTIEHFMDDDKIETSGQFKMLLLGTSDSGKSTIFRQLVNKYVKEMDSGARLDGYKTVIQHSTVVAMRDLVEVAVSCGKLDAANADVIMLRKSKTDADADAKSNYEQEMAQAVKNLWGMDVIRNDIFVHRAAYHHLHVPDNIEYFFEKCEEIAAVDYVPSFEDVVRARDSTKKANHAVLEMDGQKIDLIDVGGQRGARKKWIKFFDKVDCILFVASMSEFDQQLEEDHSTRRVDECLQVFDDTCNLPCFAKTSIVLFLNKRDLFENKIKCGIKLSEFCPQFTGDDTSIYEAIDFYKIMYTSKINDPSKQVYVHVTCATDTSNIVFTFNAVYSIVINRILAERVNFL